jgi:hypothetical protein
MNAGKSIEVNSVTARSTGGRRRIGTWLLVFWVVTWIAGAAPPCCFELADAAHAGTSIGNIHAEHAFISSAPEPQPDHALCSRLESPISGEIGTLQSVAWSPVGVPQQERLAPLPIVTFHYSNKDIRQRADIPIYLRTAHLLI